MGDFGERAALFIPLRAGSICVCGLNKGFATGIFGAVHLTHRHNL
jgi:hypothetical protein